MNLNIFPLNFVVDESSLSNLVDSYEGSTPVRFLPNRANNSLDKDTVPVQPFPLINPIAVSFGRKLPL